MAKNKRKNPHTQATAPGKTIDGTMVVILLILLFIIPLVNRAVFLNHAGPLITGSLLDTGSKFEFASFYKFAFLLLGTIVLLATFTYKLFKEQYEIVWDYTTFPWAVMFLFILLSGILAQYKTLGLLGQFDRHEGTLTNLAYLFVFLVSANISYSLRQTRWFYIVLYPLIIVNVLLVWLHFYNYDVLHTPLMVWLLLPANMSVSGLSPSSYINSTFGNPDFLSGFGGIMTVLFMTRAVLVSDIKQGLISLAFAILAFATVPASMAISGFFTVVALVPLILVFILLSPQRKRGAFIGMGALVGFVLILTILYQHNPTVWDKSVGFFVHTKPGTQITASKPNKPAAPPAQPSSKPATTTDNEFQLPPAKWAAGTGRVYIWQRTVELIEQRPIFGYGLDNLPYYFPQDDPLKNSGLNSPDTIVDKPHNNYLGYAFGSGVFTLLAFLVLLVRHFWQNIKLFRTGLTGERRITLISLFTAWCAYLVQSLFNDSTIGVSVIFWILFGLSVSLLRAEAKETATN